MIEIAISSELAAEHPAFMTGCAERGHQVDVFDTGAPGDPTCEQDPQTNVDAPIGRATTLRFANEHTSDWP